MIDLYERKLKAEIKKIKVEIKESEKKWYRKPDIVLKSLIFIASAISVFYISNLYDIKNERLELKRDKLEIQIDFFKKKKDSLNNDNIYLSQTNDSLSNSNRNLLKILDRLKNDSINQNKLIVEFRKQIREINNRKKSEDLEKTLDEFISSSISPAPVHANAGSDVTICLGESVKLTASGGSSYLWSTGETTKSIYVDPERTTRYTVKATRGGYTNSDTVMVTVENCSSTSDNNSSFKIYPNPSTGKLRIKAKK